MMVPDRVKVTVLGGGSFGTAIANILADNNHDIRLWMRNAELADEINAKHENTRYLPGFSLNPKLKAMTNLEEAVSSAQILFVAVPSKSVPDLMSQCKPWLQPHQVLISTTKGIQEKGFRMMSQVLREDTVCERIGVLSGPNLAKELAARTITGTVIASDLEEVRSLVQRILSSKYFRVYANSDMFGVELGGSLKNIYAIASGMAAAMGLGENTKGILITRSLAEMSRFAMQLGGNPMSFLGLSGVGDLFVTCTSPLSRNYQVGYFLGQGDSLEVAREKLGETAEGVNTTKIVCRKSRELNVYMPLVSGLYEIMFENGELKDVIMRLMLSEQKSDVEFVLPDPKYTD